MNFNYIKFIDDLSKNAVDSIEFNQSLGLILEPYN